MQHTVASLLIRNREYTFSVHLSLLLDAANHANLLLSLFLQKTL